MYYHSYSSKKVIFILWLMLCGISTTQTGIIANSNKISYQRSVLDSFTQHYPKTERSSTGNLFSLPSHEECMHTYVPLLSEHLNDSSITLDPMYLTKMDIFGQESSVFKAVDNTKTAIGSLQLGLQLAIPLSNAQELSQRQTIIKALLDHPEINSLLINVAQKEPAILHFFESQPEAQQKYIDQYYFGNRLSRFNKNPAALQALVGGNYLRLAKQFLIVPSYVLLATYTGAMNARLALFSAKIICKKKLDNLNRELNNFDLHSPQYSQTERMIDRDQSAMKAINKSTKKFSLSVIDNLSVTAKNIKAGVNLLYNPFRSIEEQKIDYIPKTLGDIAHKIHSEEFPIQNIHLKRACVGGVVAAGVGILGYQLYSSYRAVNATVQQTEVFNHLHQHMIKIADYIRTIDQLRSIINADTVLSTLEELQPITHFREQLSTEAQRLVGILETNTFNTDTPTVFSLSGRVLAAYKLMQQVKHEFIPSLQALGILDAYMSTTHLINKTGKHNGHYTFAHYVFNQDKPYLGLNNFWNPLIDFKKAVPNSIEFGGTNPQNAILTGPNTAGKTTTLRSIILNAHLAQTLGVCAAQEALLTPFSTLNCYINVTDELSAGVSLFKAEVLRAKALLVSIESLNNNGVALSLIDEMFSGTAPQEGEQAAYAFAKRLGLFNNSITIVATHYPKLTELADQGNNFGNYQMSAWKDQDGWHRPFSIQPGISTINIAADLLAEEGIL